MWHYLEKLVDGLGRWSKRSRAAAEFQEVVTDALIVSPVKTAVGVARDVLIVWAALFLFWRVAELLSPVSGCAAMCVAAAAPPLGVVRCCPLQPAVLPYWALAAVGVLMGSFAISKFTLADKLKRSSFAAVIVMAVSGIYGHWHRWPLWFLSAVLVAVFFLMFWGYRLSFLVGRRRD